MVCESPNAKAEQVLRAVIGAHRKVYQCMVFADSLGKSVTVRYVSVTGREKAQIEAMRVIKAFRDAGTYTGYAMRVFAANMDGQNVGSIEVDSPDIRAYGFKRVGHKWVGQAIETSDAYPTPNPSLTIIEETAEITPEQWESLRNRRVSDVFRRLFYGVPKIDAKYLTDDELKKLSPEEYRNLYNGQFFPPDDEDETPPLAPPHSNEEGDA